MFLKSSIRAIYEVARILSRSPPRTLFVPLHPPCTKFSPVRNRRFCNRWCLPVKTTVRFRGHDRRRIFLDDVREKHRVNLRRPAAMAGSRSSSATRRTTKRARVQHTHAHLYTCTRVLYYTGIRVEISDEISTRARVRFFTAIVIRFQNTVVLVPLFLLYERRYTDRYVYTHTRTV